MDWYHLYIASSEKRRVQLHDQHAEHTCCPATMRNLFELMGKEPPSEKVLSRQLRTHPKYGTECKNIERVLSMYSIPSTPCRSLKEIESSLKDGCAILVNYINIDNDGHFALIVGEADDKFVIIDPDFSKNTVRQIEKKRFLENWESESEPIKHFGLAIPLNS